MAEPSPRRYCVKAPASRQRLLWQSRHRPGLSLSVLQQLGLAHGTPVHRSFLSLLLHFLWANCAQAQSVLFDETF